MSLWIRKSSISEIIQSIEISTQDIWEQDLWQKNSHKCWREILTNICEVFWKKWMKKRKNVRTWFDLWGSHYPKKGRRKFIWSGNCSQSLHNSTKLVSKARARIMKKKLIKSWSFQWEVLSSLCLRNFIKINVLPVLKSLKIWLMQILKER